MSLKIRLSRGGSKKRPHFLIVIAESRSPRDGRFVDRIGYYNPLLPKEHADRLRLDIEKAKSWLAKGATASDRVHRFLADAGQHLDDALVDGGLHEGHGSAAGRQAAGLSHSPGHAGRRRHGGGWDR